MLISTGRSSNCYICGRALFCCYFTLNALTSFGHILISIQLTHLRIKTLWQECSGDRRSVGVRAKICGTSCCWGFWLHPCWQGTSLFQVSWFLKSRKKENGSQSFCMYLDTKTNNDKNDGVVHARKYLWNLTEYPETSVWARVGCLDHSLYHHHHRLPQGYLPAPQYP